jgi:glycosyltransferase involved in cell wall biosynthesis
MHIQEPVAFGLIGLRHRFFRSEINKYANHIIAISQDNANRVNIPQKTTVVYNFLKLPTCEVLEKKYHTKKVLYLGGAAYIKGFHILVDCLDYLDSDITVIFAGYYPKRLSNNFKSKLKLILRKKRVIIEALKKISTKKNCIHIGLISDIEPVFKNVCCLVSPFTIEHFSRPIIEAFAHYTPVIASNIDGIGEIVDHNYDGLIFAKNNHIELAHAINYLCNTPEIAKKMGLNGRKKAAELYTSKNIFKITCIYEYLMKE